MRWLAVLALPALFLAGCGQGTAGTSKPQESTGPVASETMSVPSPIASQVAVPSGRVAFDRYDVAFGAEGPYMGTMIIRPDGTDERSFSVPLTSFGLGAAWSRDGEQFVVNMWTEADQGVRPGVVDVDGSDFAKLVPDGVDGDFGCSDWNPDGNTLLCAMSGIDPDVDGIYTMRIDDLHLERLTTSPFHFTEGSAGMWAAARTARSTRRTVRGSPTSDSAAGSRRSFGGRVCGYRIDGLRWHGPARARRAGQGQESPWFADLVVPGWDVDCVRQPGGRPVPGRCCDRQRDTNPRAG